jgi:hypothetical protein
MQQLCADSELLGKAVGSHLAKRWGHILTINKFWTAPPVRWIIPPDGQAPRIHIPGAWYHVTTRGNERREFRNLPGNPGREVVYWLARRHAGMTLAQLGQGSGAADYAAVAMALRRSESKIEKDAKLRIKMQELEEQMLKVKM